MGINVKDASITKSAEELAAKCGVSVEEAIGLAVREKLAQESTLASATPRRKGSMEEAREIIRHYQSLPVYDPRSPHEIIDDLWNE